MDTLQFNATLYNNFKSFFYFRCLKKLNFINLAFKLFRLFLISFSSGVVFEKFPYNFLCNIVNVNKIEAYFHGMNFCAYYFTKERFFMMKADIGLIGLAVMGENLVLNMEHHGFSVSVFNRTVKKVNEFLSGRAIGKNIIGTHSINEFVSSLEKPRKIVLMIRAGEAVDSIIEQLLPFLDEDDIIIDAGNSYFEDTRKRSVVLHEKNICFIGAGVSGGEEGALNGPSIMPGGDLKAWKYVEPIFKAIAAKSDDGGSCCEWMGSDGAGHFVKMVHNGIEYGDMQLICEAYFLMKIFLKMPSNEIADVFHSWKKTKLDSYLIDITADILNFLDDGEYLVEKIKDTAGQKGTGKWTVAAALELGVPLNLISGALFSRFISSMREERIMASKEFSSPRMRFLSDKGKKDFLYGLQEALHVSKIISYAQGFALLKAADKKYLWDLNYGEIAMIWRGGCIIRSAFLDQISQAFKKDPNISNLMLDEYFKNHLIAGMDSLRSIVSSSVQNGIPIPAFSAALNYFDAYRTKRLPANLLQAQRDYFGAHTYERIDSPNGEFFHTDWTLSS